MVSGYKNKIAHQDFLDAGGFAILDKIINVEQLNKIIEDCSKHYEENG